jgi:hypothetical protein
MIRTYQAQVHDEARFATAHLALVIATAEFKWTLEAHTTPE